MRRKNLKGFFRNKRLSLPLTVISLVFAVIFALYFGTKDPQDPTPLEGSFEVHFIDVGQADSALVMCDGKYMLIDAGNKEDSNLLYTYLKKHDVKHLDYVIATHIHEDHVGGMGGALNYATPGIVYCPVDSNDSYLFKTIEKHVKKANSKILVPTAGESFMLGSARVDILGCNFGEPDDINNTSIVLKVTYGETSFLFTGDAEREAEKVLVDSGVDLSATVLKVGHHGSNTSTSYVFLREVMPKYGIISVEKGNEYGHPHSEPLSRLMDADVEIYRTDFHGDIICKSDGVDVTFTTTKKK